MLSMHPITLLLTGIAAIQAAPTDKIRRATTPISAITTTQWAALNQSVGGRLHKGYPMAKPCYSVYNGALQAPSLAQCSAVQTGYTDEVYIASQYGGYMNTNWGYCQATAKECGLDFNLPANPLYYTAPANCQQGSVPDYYIDVRQVLDIQAGLAFASSTGVPLVIKNSGHDYKGRSSGPSALALWTHNVQPALKLDQDFVPDGCTVSAGKGVTMGAGQGFAGLYEFAEANQITIVGGSSRTVGAAGGWISGGGHGALSNTLGLGVDNVLQIKAVLPDGTYVTANRCQNQDIFFALRGGGGSTYGVNYEMTTTAHPQVTLQVAYIRFVSLDVTSINKFIAISVQNADKWATEGWGGYIAPGAQGKVASGMILMTPKLSHDEAVASMKPMTDYIASLGNVPINNEVDESPSFYQAYQKYILPNEEVVGLGLAIGSRLIPRDILQTDSGKQTVIDALQKIASMVTAITGTASAPDLRSITYGPPLQILVTAPSSYPNNDTVPASITPAWRDAIWHVIGGQAMANNAGVSTINKAFQTAHDVAKILEGVAPNSGAYQNEADVFQNNPTQTFWGSNYQRLLSIKKQVDPKNVLTCWDCVGGSRSDTIYGCYPAAPS
ncbi:hypothetical protein LTR56_000644 [Elasticomyces elasticus]|nr:hypothetical protein LTR56_000644 [Elasticomyces elasticus]KAK3664422.1 hypothetical protein LTR22_004835 [Elasticomyces elasticus]KAK4919424.1 hypothetical protein LTR49_012958 [Elasticomyces elasticus]KAK5758298.1 hypothetical protein LTS12_011621 [Elasticomyces elasticus]